MNEGILGAIANPQLADVAGALDYRRAQMDKDEAKRKELRMNQFIAQAIPNMAADSPVRKIFEDDPKTGAMLSKMMGIPLNDGEAWEKFRGNVAQLHSLAKVDPRMAIERANAIKAENDRLGIVDQPLNRWVGSVNSAMEKGDQDGVITQFNALGVMNDNLNPVKADVISAEKKEEFRIKEKELDWKMSQPEGGGENAGVQSSNILDDGTVIQVLKSGGTRVVDPAGNVLSGQSRADAIKAAQNYGAEIQSARAGGRTAATETAKDVSKYKATLFDSINNGNRTLNKYEMAIEQIDKGAESGPVMKMLPSLQDSTLLVDTIRKDIGMEIIGSGVLGVNPTDADVKLAMEVAIPEGLRPDVLKKEIKRRAQVINDLNSAQREYYKMLDSGKTKGDILKMAEEKRANKSDGGGSTIGRFQVKVGQ